MVRLEIQPSPQGGGKCIFNFDLLVHVLEAIAERYACLTLGERLGK